MVIPSSTLTSALKEWAVAVDALAQGQTIVLLRKGGIREQSGSFTVDRSRIWLYPTYEHQKPHFLKPEYANQVTPVASGWHPEAIDIQAWAEITHLFQVSEAAIVEALMPFHVWNAEFVSERLKWKPKSPLFVLLLRVYRLPTLQRIPYRSEYGGCKSWIELGTELLPVEAKPVLTEESYLSQVRDIHRLIAN
ncbi:MAG: DUF1802 family protein [Cyanobacteria bacterium CRU_2_1]|nr:DUF1802 family protein [Cyanobacteria bacterium RU_5_0]NJR59938.1 DUF1802 family protein [Cyanobacteria bacterium CRU_2_1]